MALLFGLFFVLAWNVLLDGSLNQMDRKVMRWISGLRDSAITDIFLFFTAVGSMRIIITVAAVVLIILALVKRWSAMTLIIFSVASGDLVSRILKIIIQRARPDVNFSLVARDGYAFPSGHATNAMVFYGILFIVVWPYCQKRWQKYLLTGAVAVTVCMVGLSRAYLGVHWMSDVLGGWLLGGMVLLMINMLEAVFRDYFRKQ